MTAERRAVLVVPGLHPRGCEKLQRLAYERALSKWPANGYDVTLQQFGWNDALPLADRQNALLETIDDMPEHISAIGASAGALAVIGALQAAPEKFDKILTIAAPLHLTETEFKKFKQNPVVPIPDILREAYIQADNFLSIASLEGLSKIISLHGRHDPRVLPDWSQRPPLTSYELPVSGHGRTIMYALKKHRALLQGLL
ncbi:MAG TPA: hypothetical protein VFZ58_05035 [Candidatus Saccharimonadales bacterium]